MLTFDEEKHEYRWDGVVVPSVTQILRPLSDFSAIPKDVLERKRQIGTATHKAIELHLDGGVDPDSIDPAVRPYFEAFLQFESDTGFMVETCEERVYSEKYRYAGTLDLIGRMQDEEILIDIKTASAFSPSWGPQTAAYQAAMVVDIPRRAALQLMPTGKYRLHNLDRPGDLATFLACLNIYNFHREHAK